MGSVIRSVYGFLSRTVTERWAGSLHAGALVKGLYLQWMLGPRLRKAAGTAFDAGCGEQAQFARLLARRFPAWRFVGMDLKIAAGRRRAALIAGITPASNETTTVATATKVRTPPLS